MMYLTSHKDGTAKLTSAGWSYVHRIINKDFKPGTGIHLALDAALEAFYVIQLEGEDAAVAFAKKSVIDTWQKVRAEQGEPPLEIVGDPFEDQLKPVEKELVVDPKRYSEAPGGYVWRCIDCATFITDISLHDKFHNQG
jgi:hypothetical protein